MNFNDKQLIWKPIGIFHSSTQERYLAPRQPNINAGLTGKIELFPHQNYHQALEDLQGFDKIWVVFWFNRNETWNPKVMPPRGQKKRGVFATRSPHRPNPIGISCVTLTKIDKLTLHIDDHDLLDGTPILDIKPYITYSDSHPGAKQGWLETLEPTIDYKTQWQQKAKVQALWIEKQIPEFADQIERILAKHNLPQNSNRIEEIGDNNYELAFKTWRIRYRFDYKFHFIIIADITTGYDRETLSGEKKSEWSDVPIHVEFLNQNW